MGLHFCRCTVATVALLSFKRLGPFPITIASRTATCSRDRYTEGSAPAVAKHRTPEHPSGPVASEHNFLCCWRKGEGKWRVEEEGWRFANPLASMQRCEAGWRQVSTDALP